MKAEWTNRDNLSIEETTEQNSKSILVIDTPENCKMCPFRQSSWSFCLGEYEKEKHCPLRPLPQKTDISKNELNEKQYMYFQCGWNACLDVIMGETE